MSDSLVIYLQDHLAGSVHAIELVESIQSQHSGKPLGSFATDLLAEIKADSNVLRELAERAGTSSSSVKDLTAWIGEKVAKLKLKHGGATELGTLEALELLELGVHGKWALWRALATVAPAEKRLQGVDFEHLAARAQAQRSKVEEHRLEAAHVALRPTQSKAA